MKKFLKILFTIVSVIIIGYFVYYFILSERIKECPDEKIINNMPGSSPSSYYIQDGARKEISSYNNVWVRNNCNVPVQEVY